MSTKETIQNLQNSKLQQEQMLQQLEQISELLLSLTTLMQQNKPHLDLTPLQTNHNEVVKGLDKVATYLIDLKKPITLSTTNMEEVSQSLNQLNKTVGTMVTGYNKIIDQGVKVVEVEKQVPATSFTGWLMSTLITVALILGPMYYFKDKLLLKLSEQVRPILVLDRAQLAKDIAQEWAKNSTVQKR